MEPETPLAPGSVSLEEPGEIVGQVAQTETPPVETPPAEPEPEPEGTIQIPQGKVVPLGAVTAERGKRKEAETRAAALEEKLKQLEPKAARYDEAAQYLQQARPIIEKIRQRPDLVQLADQPAAPAKEPVGPLSEAEAIDYAKDLDLYTPEGKPDVDRAQRFAKRQEAISAKQTQRAMAPFQQQSAQQQSNALKQAVLNTVDGQGNKVDPAVLDEMWANVPVELSSQPHIANAIYIMAMGAQTISGKGPKPAPPPVVHTESVGTGAKPPGEHLSRISEGLLGASNMKRSEFLKQREQWKLGERNSLED